jgi:hypothetical protein
VLSKLHQTKTLQTPVKQTIGIADIKLNKKTDGATP